MVEAPRCDGEIFKPSRPRCTFERSSGASRNERRGVPEAVLKAMVEAPYGPQSKVAAAMTSRAVPSITYAEQLKQMGFFAPFLPGRGLQPSRQARARTNSGPTAFVSVRELLRSGGIAK